MVSHLLKEKVKSYCDKLYPLQILKEELDHMEELREQLEVQLQESRKRIIDNLCWTSIFIESPVSKIYKEYFRNMYGSPIEIWESNFGIHTDLSEGKLLLHIGYKNEWNNESISKITRMLMEKIPGIVGVKPTSVRKNKYLEVKLSNSQINQLKFEYAIRNPDSFYWWESYDQFEGLIESGLRKEECVQVLEKNFMKEFGEIEEIRGSELKMLRTNMMKELEKRWIMIKRVDLQYALRKFWLKNLGGLERVIDSLIRGYPLENEDFEEHFIKLLEQINLYIEIDEREERLIRRVARRAYDEIIVFKNFEKLII